MKGSIELSMRQIILLLLLMIIAVIIIFMSIRYSGNIKLWHQNLTNITL